MFAGMALWIVVLDPLPTDVPRPWSGWRLRDVLLTLTAWLFLMYMTGYVWAVVLSQWELRGRPPVLPLTRNLGLCAGHLFAFVTAIWAFGLAPYRLGPEAVGLTPVAPGWMVAGAVLGLLGGPGLYRVTHPMDRLTEGPVRRESELIDWLIPPPSEQVGPWTAVIGMFFLVVVFPCAEELLFRGIAYPGLRNSVGVWIAVPVSALIFGFGHWGRGCAFVGGNTVMGVIAALLVEGSGSLWPAMLTHSLLNSKVVVPYYRSFREAGIPPEKG
jgi:membrane protease YdiL (CAAX protease family)